MDEADFDSLTRWRPFGTADVTRAEAQARRTTALSLALGKTAEDLQRHLLAPHPEIPPGFDLADFQNLAKCILHTAAVLRHPPLGWMSSLPYYRAFCSPEVVVGTQHFTAWEARYEIVRRAIEFLEGR
jgi:hypothetical protein